MSEWGMRQADLIRVLRRYDYIGSSELGELYPDRHPALSAMLSRMKRAGLVEYREDIRAYRLTAQGRATERHGARG